MSPPKPRNADEAQLEEAQKTIIRGLRAEQTKRELLLKLWRKGYTQADLAERLSRASQAVGGEEVTVNSVHKVIWKFRHKNGEVA